MTNYEKIKAMSIEELSNFLKDWFIDCIEGKAPINVTKWLDSETDDNT